MKIDLMQFRKTFLQESADHISALETNLLELHSHPRDLELLNAIFRSAHSIKGGAGTFGMENLARFTHALESLLDRLRTMEIALTQDTIDCLLQSTDVLRQLLDSPEDPMPGEAQQLAERLAVLAAAGPPPGDQQKAVNGAPPEGEGEGEDLPVYRIEFRPDRDLFSSGANPIILLRSLAGLGDLAGVHLHSDELPSLASLNPEKCYLAWSVEIATSRSEEELREVFEFVEHIAEISITRIRTAADESTASGNPAAPPACISRAGKVDGDTPANAAGSRANPGSRPARTGESMSIRVATDKVDRLIDLVGELMIAHVMTAQMVTDFTPARLSKLRQQMVAMERNTRELHERVMAIRMLPVGTLFQRYARAVYDIAQSTGKQIELKTAGEETEIDKSMLDLLGDPLTHLIRNAADHGIEAPEMRTAAGKPASGTISLRAFHRAGRVVIEVRDDGGGIDPARVRAKAVARGLIAQDAQMTDQQLRMLIFEPGFSTRDEVNGFSGRGVGMDVVRQNVRELNGEVTVSSEVGVGSTVSIDLPLTLAILEGLLVRVADRILVLPLTAVVETVCPGRGQIQRVAGVGDVVVIRDESIPLLPLGLFLGITLPPGGPQAGCQLVVVLAGHRKFGLVIDELLGQQQVVVKSLERHLRKVEGLMGATILGDGRVAPILDVGSLAGLNLCALSDTESVPRDSGAVTGNINLAFQPEGRKESAHAMV